jgi:hypothetical protein
MVVRSIILFLYYYQRHLCRFYCGEMRIFFFLRLLQQNGCKGTKKTFNCQIYVFFYRRKKEMYTKRRNLFGIFRTAAR